MLLWLLDIHLSPIHTFPAQMCVGWEWARDLAGQGHLGPSGEWPSRVSWDCEGKKKTWEREDGKRGLSIHLWLPVFCSFISWATFSHLSSPLALSCSARICCCMPAGTGSAQSGWNWLWRVSLLWCFQICLQVFQTKSGCFFWSYAALPMLWYWNQVVHEQVHFLVASNSVVLWNLLSMLSSGSSDAMTRWQCYQQLHTFFPSLDSENLNSEETRNTEAGKAMATLPCVHPWFGEMCAVLSWKMTWRKAKRYPRKAK